MSCIVITQRENLEGSVFSTSRKLRNKKCHLKFDFLISKYIKYRFENFGHFRRL